MNTVVSIPDDIFEKAERRARSLGMSRDEFYAAALAGFVGEARDRKHARDQSIIGEQHASLNAEAEDVLAFQVAP